MVVRYSDRLIIALAIVCASNKCIGQPRKPYEKLSLTISWQKDIALKSDNYAILRLSGYQKIDHTSVVLPNYTLHFSNIGLNNVDSFRVLKYLFVRELMGIRIENDVTNLDTLVAYAELVNLSYLIDSVIVDSGLFVRRSFNGIRFDLNREISFGFALDVQKKILSDLYVVDKRNKISIGSYSQRRKRMVYFAYIDTSLQIMPNNALGNYASPIYEGWDIVRLRMKRTKIKELYYVKDGVGHVYFESGRIKYIGKVHGPLKSDVLIVH